MSILHVKHIQAKLIDLFENKIDLTDAKNDGEKENYFLTRSFSAYSLQILAGVDINTAINGIVDGYNDNGIDLIYFDRKNKLLWLLQSKWIKNGNGEPEAGEISKFKNGIIDLVEFQLDRFNDKIQRKEKELTEALEDPLVKINIVIAYTGQENLSIHNQRLITDLLTELNDPTELAYFTKFSLKMAHNSLVGILEGTPIKAELSLSNWGKVEEPYYAIYGTISGADLANIWTLHRSRLFSDNIREFIGFSEVNEDILDTIKKEPDNFYFYNNGVTALCQSIDKKPIGGGDRQHGVFIAEDFKVVNGAQTVGTLGNALDKKEDSLSKTKVFIKIISLKGCPDNFGLEITKKTNTQNKIDKRDFVSLDTEQDRLKTELALEGIHYYFKRSDDVQKYDNENIYVEEVITSIACFLDDIDLTVQAKREVGKLWEDITKKPYIDIINKNVTATQVIRCVKALRELTKFLKTKESTVNGRLRSHYIHANRLLLHLIFQSTGKDKILNPQFSFEKFMTNDFVNLAQELFDKLSGEIERVHSASLVHQIYRNFTKCRQIKKDLGY